MLVRVMAINKSISFKKNVMGEYKKITKEDIDFPNYCLFFIKEIIDSLEEYDIKNPGDELSLEIETTQHPYCYDAFELIAKTFNRKGYDMKIPTFKLKNENGIKTYTYKWKILKIQDSYDLPF